MLGCPRCAYDLVGVVESWGEACPLRGVCSECGLAFEWADVFVPPRCEGFVEHAIGVRQWAWWGVRTFLRVWRPRRFWRRVKMEHPVRVGRAAVWLLCAAIVGYLSVPLVALCVKVGENILAGALIRGPRGFFLAGLKNMPWFSWGVPNLAARTGWWNWSGNRIGNVWRLLAIAQYPWWFLPFVVMGCVGPLVFVLAPWTRGRAKVRAGHLWRWWLYGQAWVILLFAWLVVFVVIEGVQSWLGKSLPPAGSRSPPSNATGIAVLWDVESWHGWMEFAAAPMESKVVMPALLFLWLAWWNWCALKRGMRLEKAARIWGALILVAAAAGQCVIVAQEVLLDIAVRWP